jgi:hypothetical protein
VLYVFAGIAATQLEAQMWHRSISPTRYHAVRPLMTEKDVRLSFGPPGDYRLWGSGQGPLDEDGGLRWVNGTMCITVWFDPSTGHVRRKALARGRCGTGWELVHDTDRDGWGRSS